MCSVSALPLGFPSSREFDRLAGFREPFEGEGLFDVSRVREFSLEFKELTLLLRLFPPFLLLFRSLDPDPDPDESRFLTGSDFGLLPFPGDFPGFSPASTFSTAGFVS